MVIHALIWSLMLMSMVFQKLFVLQTPILPEVPAATMDHYEIYDMTFYVTIPLLPQGFVTRNSMSLSKQEAEFLATFSAKGKTIFTFLDPLEFWETQDAATKSLDRLVRKHWLFRLENGLFMVISLEAGPECEWSKNALIIASYLVSPGAIAHGSAMRLWNMTEQLPCVQFFQTTKRKRSLSIQGISYRFVTVSEKHFFGMVSKQNEGQTIVVTDREKALIVAADRPYLSGGMIQLVEGMPTSSSHIDWEKLTGYLEKWGGGSVAKRLGYLLEVLALPISNRDIVVSKWKTMISKGISTLDSWSPKVGPTIVRWKLQINFPGLLPKEK